MSEPLEKQSENPKLPSDDKLVGGNVMGSESLCVHSKVEAYLRNLKVEKLFAPGVEKLRLSYDIKGLTGKTVLFEVKSPVYSKTPIFRRELIEGEKSDQDGKQMESWDGDTSDICPEGELQKTLINPLYSPYTVAIYVPDSAYKVVGQFKVLYHSMRLYLCGNKPGDQAPPDPESQPAAWVRWRLHELGYWGGPYAADTDGYQANAIRQYRWDHPELRKLDYSELSGEVDESLLAALAKDSPRRPARLVRIEKNGDGAVVAPGDDLTGWPSKDWPDVRGRTFRIYDEVMFHSGDEFQKISEKDVEDGSGASMSAVMLARRNRPLLPLEVKIFIRDRAGEAADSPYAVGKACIEWSAAEPKEDLQAQYADRNDVASFPRRYIEKCLKLEGGRENNVSGNNCHEKYGGIRKDVFEDYRRPFFSRGYVDEDTLHDEAEAVLPFLYTEAHTGENEAHFGKAGVYFRPSKIAGDHYAVRADINFKKRPNRWDLEEAHKPEQPIMVQSHPFVNWLRTGIAAVVGWPKRDPSLTISMLDYESFPTVLRSVKVQPANDEAFLRVRQELARAYIDFSTQGMDVLSISDVLKDSELQDCFKAVKNLKLFKTPAVDPKGLLSFKDQTEVWDRGTLINSTIAITQAWGLVQTPLHEAISRKLRSKYPRGLLLVDLLPLQPVALQVESDDEKKIKVSSYSDIVGGEGMQNGLAFLGQGYPMPFWYVLAHEAGHCLWLRHWENAKSFAMDHDQEDHSCLMSYPVWKGERKYQIFGTFNPHYCGRCNLKLRGWDVKKLPDSSA
jgi:hypothetical protein